MNESTIKTKKTLGGYKSIDEFVAAKLQRLNRAEPSFETLFTLMFSERDNVLYERSAGYKIIKTTYGEAYDETLRRAATLAGLLDGVPAGAVVGLYMQNSLEWIELFWAILRCGYRPLLMNTRLDDETLASALAACDARAVLSDGRSFPVRTIPTEQVVPSDGEAAFPPFGEELLVMSSGTSLHVKVCAYTAEEFRCQIADSAEIIRRSPQMKKHYDGALKQLAFLPFYHVFGLIAMYIWFAFFSRTFVHLADMAPQTILNTIRRHHVTHIFAVPLFWDTVYEQAMATIRERGEATVRRFQKGLRLSRVIGDWPLVGKLFTRAAFREVREGLFGESICFMIAGGSEIREPVLEFFNAIGYHLADGYGMTELGITSVELSGRKKTRNAALVGKPMSSMQYRIAEDGELLVQGRSAARYILMDGKRLENDGWFSTGDLAECVRGHYRILGRKDDLIVSPSGENLNPSLIETRFDIPGVKQVCLIGAGQTGAREAVLLASVGASLTAERLESIRSALRERIGQLGLTGQISRVVLVTDDLMGQEEFKLNRARLARDYAAGRLTEAAARALDETRDADELTGTVLALFAAALGRDPDELTPDADFFLDLGGSSLDYFAVVSQIKEEHQIAFPVSDGRSLSTARQIAAFIRSGGL